MASCPLTCIHRVHDVSQWEPDADAEDDHEAEQPRVLVGVERETQVDEDDEGRENPGACSQQRNAWDARLVTGQRATRVDEHSGAAASQTQRLHPLTELKHVGRRAVLAGVDGAEDAKHEEDD